MFRDLSLDYLWPYLNPQMLYGKHMGLHGNVQKRFAQGDPKAIAMKERIDAVFQEMVGAQLVSAHAVCRYFPAQAEGNTVLIYDPGNPAQVIERFTFPRQSGGKHLCLADFVRPVESGDMDSVAFFVVTCGLGVRDLAAMYKDAGAYVRSHAIQAIAIELAEAYAEKLHQDLRDWWDFPDPPEMTMRDRLRAAYRGLGVVWLPRLPGSGGSGQAVSPAAPRGHRRAADRRLHDGPRGVGVGARAASPGGGVFSSRITPCL